MPFDTRGLWYGQQEKSGGVLFDFGSHDLDWMLWLAGLPKVVCARTLQVRAGARADEHGAAMLLFDGGAVGSCEVSWSSWLGESSVGLIGTKGSLVMGLDGKIRRKLGDGPEQVVDLEGVTAVDPTGATGKRAADGAIQEVAPRVETIQEHFFRCVATGAPPLPSAEAGRDVLRTVLALQESSRRGESVRLADVRDTRFRLSCAPAASPAAHERSAAR
jgi:predicted dehydrogenase